MVVHKHVDNTLHVLSLYVQVQITMYDSWYVFKKIESFTQNTTMYICTWWPLILKHISHIPNT